MFPISDSARTTRFPFLNILIIIFTISVFVPQISSSNPKIFIYQYALIPSSVNFGNPQTLLPFVTAIFLHGGFLHILSNMWFLFIFGDNVEDSLGFFLFPFLYLTSGIVGNLVQYFLMPASNIPILGASGAVAGVLGAYYVLFPHARIKTFIPIFYFPTIVEVGASFMLGYWFLLQIISGAASLPFTSQTGGIAFFAHIGGFVTGMIFAKIFKKS